jgi:hypothetical protein
MDEVEKTDEQYEAEREAMERLFPNAKFDICIDINELDEDFGLNCVVFKHAYTCYCYDKSHRPTDFIVIRDDKPVTVRKVIQELIHQNFNPNCNHYFLEGLNNIGTGIEIEGFFGS